MAENVNESKAKGKRLAKKLGLDELELEAPVRRAYTSTDYAQKFVGEDVVNQFPVTPEQYDIAKPLLEETEEEQAERLELEKRDVIGLEEVDHVTDLPVSNDRRMVGRAQDLLGDDFEV